MIVTIADECTGYGKAIAANLAVLRARRGRKVIVIDTDPRHPIADWSGERSSAGITPRVPALALNARGLSLDLEQILPRFNDILIDTECGEAAEIRSALIAANLVIVPLSVDQVNLKRYQLIARLNSARMFNPGLHVAFVIIGGTGDLDDRQLRAVRTYVAQVMSATLCGTILHEHQGFRAGDGDGRCASERDTCELAAAAEMAALYDEVFLN